MTSAAAMSRLQNPPSIHTQHVPSASTFLKRSCRRVRQQASTSSPSSESHWHARRISPREPSRGASKILPSLTWRHKAPACAIDNRFRHRDDDLYLWRTSHHASSVQRRRRVLPRLLPGGRLVRKSVLCRAWSSASEQLPLCHIVALV